MKKINGTLFSLGLLAFVLLGACFPVRRDLVATRQPVNVESVRVVGREGVLWQVVPRNGVSTIATIHYRQLPAAFIQLFPAAGPAKPLKFGEPIAAVVVTDKEIYCLHATALSSFTFNPGSYALRPRSYRGRQMTSQEEQQQIVACKPVE
jgi:hypothetical protein